MKLIRYFLRQARSSVKFFILALRCRTSRPLRVIIGSGSTDQAGWISTDLPHLDATKISDWGRLFGRRRIAAICTEHVWEHLTEEQGAEALQNAFEFLAPGGHIRVAVPDGYFPSNDYIERVRPGGSGPGADDHKVLYDVDALSKLGEKAGFVCAPIEFFDQDGRFNYVDWKIEDGLIRRSSRFDSRNKAGELNYTSLIIDFKKPVALK